MIQIAAIFSSYIVCNPVAGNLKRPGSAVCSSRPFDIIAIIIIMKDELLVRDFRYGCTKAFDDKEKSNNLG